MDPRLARASAFARSALARSPRHAVMALVRAPGIEREVEEIARRILEQAAAGRPFREIGIIVRAPETYVPVLRSTLERFGIPGALLFRRHPRTARRRCAFLAGAVDAMLGGWDHARHPRRSCAWRRASPNPPPTASISTCASRSPMPAWARSKALLLGDEGKPRTGANAPAQTGFDRRPRGVALVRTGAEGLGRALLAPCAISFVPRPPGASHPRVRAPWRSQAAALDLFDEALDEAAAALDPRAADRHRGILARRQIGAPAEALRLDDGRRNVVHVLSAHEARQWVLPVVFVCGMVEKQFPQFHRQDPFFPDAARCRLNAAGIRVRTAAEFEREERALFDSAVTPRHHAGHALLPGVRCARRAQPAVALPGRSGARP